MCSPPCIKTVIGSSCRSMFQYHLWQDLLASRQWIRRNKITSRCSSKQPELRVELVHVNTELIYQEVISKVISCHFWFLSHSTVWVWTHLFTEELTASQAEGQWASCGSGIINTSSLWCRNMINRGKRHSEPQDKKRELGAPEDLLDVAL